MGKLTGLKHFTLMNFPNLLITSDAIFNLSSLESLTISTCVSLDLNCPQILNDCKMNKSHLSSLSLLTLNNTALSGKPFLRTRNFENMRALFLHWHPNLTYFPFSCESNSLQTLSLKYMALLRLPVEMCHLAVLTNLEVACCSSIEIDSNISVLSSLKILSLRFLPSLNTLPNTIGKSTNLQELQIERCKLTNIPQDICKLTNLTSLHFLHVLVEDVPESIGSLVQISTIHCSVPVTQNSDSPPLLKIGSKFTSDVGTVTSTVTVVTQPRRPCANLLRAWPLPLLDTTHWHFGFSKQWHHFNLPRQAVRYIHVHSNVFLYS